MAIPALPGGEPAASLEGEELADLEILWDDISGADVKSSVHRQTIRIQATQQAGMALREAQAHVEKGRVNHAFEILRKAVERLGALGLTESVRQGMRTLQRMIDELERDGDLSSRSRKEFLYRSSTMSEATWTQDEAAPHYTDRRRQEPPAPPAAPPDPAAPRDPGSNPGPAPESGPAGGPDTQA